MLLVIPSWPDLTWVLFLEIRTTDFCNRFNALVRNGILYYVYNVFISIFKWWSRKISTAKSLSIDNVTLDSSCTSLWTILYINVYELCRLARPTNIYWSKINDCLQGKGNPVKTHQLISLLKTFLLWSMKVAAPGKKNLLSSRNWEKWNGLTDWTQSQGKGRQESEENLLQSANYLE